MPRKIPFYKSLYVPVLFVGCEKLPFIVVVTIGGVLIMAYQNMYVFIFVFLFYITSIMLIRRVNEQDSQFFSCLFRYLFTYMDYYPAHEFYPGRSDKPYTFFY